MLHPDKFNGAGTLLDEATRMSAFTSSAYFTIIDDILRAEYLLKQDFGMQVFDESKREANASLAQWVFETREEIDECETEEELLAI